MTNFNACDYGGRVFISNMEEDCMVGCYDSAPLGRGVACIERNWITNPKLKSDLTFENFFEGGGRMCLLVKQDRTM